VLWVVPGTGDTTAKLHQHRRDFEGTWYYSPWSACHLRLFHLENGKLEEIANFAKDAAAAVGRVSPPSTPACDRQRLYVNPKNGMLYVMEGDTGAGKAVLRLLRIDPDTNRSKEIRLPFAAEDMAFDLNGLAYLRSDVAVARFDPALWQEVPYDCGEEMRGKRGPGFNGRGSVRAAIYLPTTGKPGCFHLGGFGVAPNGNVVVSCWNARPALDLFARSFATELGRCRVAILDTNGNLIMRIGKYGSVDDGLPLITDGGPEKPRSIGGNEVALAKPAYLATHTDRRLFIADYGNYRILSVNLGYHAEETLPMASVPEGGH